jgi:hypothetical protein
MFGAQLDDINNQGKGETERFAAQYVAATEDTFYDIGQGVKNNNIIQSSNDDFVPTLTHS